MFTNVPEASSYTLVYDLSIPNTAAFNVNSIPYTVDIRGSIADGSFDRIAYYLELDTGSGLEYAYVSMDAFTDDAGKIGVPSRGPNGSFTTAGEKFQQNVSNMNVVSNAPGIVTGDGITTGNIEFWSSSYGGTNSAAVPNAVDSLFDFGDQPSGASHYGSMQIHNHDLDGSGSGTAGQTIIAYNRWASLAGELGIGNQPTGHPDWTFSNNIATYSVKTLQILVRPGP